MQYRTVVLAAFSLFLLGWGSINLGGGTPDAGGTSIVQAQSAVRVQGSISVDVSMGSSVTTGNTLILLCSKWTSQPLESFKLPVMSGCSGTWIEHMDLENASTFIGLQVSSADITSGGTCVVTGETENTQSTTVACVLTEWENVPSGDIAIVSAGETTSTQPASGNLVACVGECLFIGVMRHRSGSPTITVDGGWNTIHQINDQSFTYIVQTGATDQAEWTLSASAPWVAGALYFEP